MKHIFILLFLTAFLFSNDVLTINQNETAYELGQSIDYYVDEKGNQTLEDIRSEKFISHHEPIPNFGFSTQTYWFKLQYNYVELMKSKEWWLNIDYALLDFVDIYVFDEKENLLIHKESGDLNSEAKRDVEQNKLLFSLPTESLGTYTLYMKVKTTGSMFVPMQIISSKPLLETTHLNQTLTGMYYGILFILILYNSVIYIYTREKIYILYVSFVISYALWQLSFDGLGMLYLWQDSQWMKEKSTVLFIYSSTFLLMLFSQTLLKAKTNIPRYNKYVLQPLRYISAVGILASIVLPYNNTIILGAVLATGVPAALFIAGLMVIKKDYYSIRLFVLGWGIFLIGTILFTLSKFNLMSGYIIMKYAQQIASVIDMILLSGALAERFKRLQDEYTYKLKNHNKNLQNAVTDALKLERKKDKILIEQSRLASIGEMIEQIAHQWRQPLNDLGLLNQNLYFKQQLGTLEDDDFIKTHNSIDSTIKYMSDTIDDFRNYYKSDKEEETYQLSSAIESILSIVRPTLEHSGIQVTLKLDYEVNVRNVKNELQQVLLIILNNAKDAMIINAIEDKKITIEVTADEKNAYIHIGDNGGGVPEDIKAKIYDPYFTTKFTGQGTGIGLYMSKIIIEKNMHGYLSLKNLDDGACFSVKLPLA
ncbi:sensor histidine kinase [Sulfurimonas gotlandica GD1]|uniref:histidine kinase n=1 Tax=Sulfurimonas gotlandica (strain DSM 19862 / JCM 16533 / GD1) TaxID=929558 RepID=B6BI35_SULGG|nr:sensor histidine kinase [Sulfurimonas gotlandica]EDZ63402.1 histidine kinase [Sulfurimonas gotlandica GD1]EHP30188.1 sensor histidine kinase [Sulfurimonas gotlandica GD1]